jgi:hypothetical protein
MKPLHEAKWNITTYDINPLFWKVGILANRDQCTEDVGFTWALENVNLLGKWWSQV